MEDLLHRTLGEQIELESSLAADLWTALTDANQLESALLNLAINARDAMPAGGRLTIETANTRLDAADTSLQDDVEPGEYVIVSVSDTGTGMQPDVAAKAIDPFFTTKPVGEGTGLGLSMIYGFVKQGRGHLRIYSEVGQGTTVKLYLPRALQNAVDLVPRTIETPRGRGETILIVEDDATVRLILSDVLEELGYNVLVASDARPAIPLLQSDQRIDLMVSDVVLPHINGRKLAEIARACRPDLRVLFVTGYAENATFRGDFLDPGMDMLTKPFALDALGAKVREMIER
jgi:CheY-like chemotaxis protein